MNDSVTTYVVSYGTTPEERFRASVHSSRDEALAEAARQPAGDCALVIGCEEDITLSKAAMAAVFRALTGAGPARMEDRSSGAKRLMLALARHAEANDLLQPSGETLVKEQLQQPAAPEAQDDDAAQSEAPSKPQRQQRKKRGPKLGKFKAVRKNSHLGAIIEHSGEKSIETLALEIGISADKIEGVLKRARIMHGIDHKFTEPDEHLLIVLPSGVTSAFVSPPKPRRQAAGINARGNVKQIAEAAARGVMPEAPDFSANTHRSHRGKLAALHALVEAHDLDALREWKVKRDWASNKALMRYRDNAIAALEAQRNS